MIDSKTNKRSGIIVILLDSFSTNSIFNRLIPTPEIRNLVDSIYGYKED
ncbi:MAG: hypothetical protein ACRCXQ_00275 [Vagococcus fluvialis]